MDLGLRGKRAFVSGSSSGIGKAIAIGVAQAGCDVVVHGRDRPRTDETAHAVEALGVKAVATYGDLATTEGCADVAKAALDAFGAVDIVVNNCGIALRKDDPPWSEIPVQTWVDSFEVNFMSALRMSQNFLPGIREKGWGRFINISSAGATMSGILTEYGCAKAAMNKLTSDMAKDVGRYGATCNGIMPGVILSPATEEWLRILGKQNNWEGDLPEFEHRYLTEMDPQPITRFGRAEDVADLTVFLASERARHMTGVTVRIDGGANKSVYL